MAKAKTPKQLNNKIRSLKKQLGTYEKALKKASAVKKKKPVKKTTKRRTKKKAVRKRRR